MNEVSRRQLLQGLGLGAVGMGALVWGGKGLNSMVEAAESAPPARLPEFQGIQTWLNSPPLTVADLKGKVVAIHIWTFACINCQRTLPYIVDLHRKYASQGLAVVGVHTPEFPYERDINNRAPRLIA